MLFDLLLISAATVLIGSLPPERMAEALARLDVGSLIDRYRPQSTGKELLWLEVGPPNSNQWEASGDGGVIYKVWFEQGIGWRVRKIQDGIASLEMTAVSEQAAKGVAVVEHG